MRNNKIEGEEKKMCQYCKNGISFVNTNMVRTAIDYTSGSGNNTRIDCFDTNGKEMTVFVKLKFCPMCGEKL